MFLGAKRRTEGIGDDFSFVQVLRYSLSGGWALRPVLTGAPHCTLTKMPSRETRARFPRVGPSEIENPRVEHDTLFVAAQRVAVPNFHAVGSFAPQPLDARFHNGARVSDPIPGCRGTPVALHAPECAEVGAPVCAEVGAPLAVSLAVYDGTAEVPGFRVGRAAHAVPLRA